MTLAAFRFLTAAVRRGPAAGPTSAADGPMNPTNRNAEPTHSTPERMWKNRNTIMNGDVASICPPSGEPGRKDKGDQAVIAGRLLDV
jgi:hypothetical protein